MGNIMGSLFRLRQVSFTLQCFKVGQQFIAEGECLRMLRWATLASRLSVLCYGLISIGHKLSFIYFGWVLKGLLVFSTAKCITLPLELFAMTIGII